MEKQLRKIKAMHHYYGVDPKGRVCIECDHLIWGEYHDKRYYKCTVYGCSHSEATDWRKSYTACGLIGKSFPNEDNRIIDILKKKPIRKEEEIEGQLSINELLEGWYG